MSEFRELTWGDVDKNATLAVDRSMTDSYSIVVGRFGPVKTGFGQRLTVPLTGEQSEQDPGLFIELTYEQALDLNAKLAARLIEVARER